MTAVPLSEETRARPLVVRATGLIGLGTVAIVASLSDVNILVRAAPGLENFGPPFAAPGPSYPFGTDFLGRDILSETLHALAVTVDEVSTALLVVLICGSLLGYLVAHFSPALIYAFRGFFRVSASVPALFLAILLTSMGAPLWVAAGLAVSPLAFGNAFARARALTRSAHADFARATGVPGTMLLRRDLQYELRANALGEAARALAQVTIVIATVSFLGFGARPPHRDLGLMIAASRENLLAAWWTAAFPALVLVLLIFFARLAAGFEEGT